MKKYLMTGIAALAMCAGFTSCSKDLTPMTQEEINDLEATKIAKTYEAAFLNYVGGTISPNQDWGFGANTATRATRAGNPGENFAATSTGINANANEWADPTPGKTFGGLVVPDPLTSEQKAVVAAYFQTVKPLTYTDPRWRNFFVQQVYKGGNTTVNNTKEGIQAANNTSYYTSDNMNLLTVGKNEQHINNFNGGSYGVENGATYGTAGEGGVGVLNKGYTANDFANHHHTDQIMLMVGIDDTECMGYHSTGSSQQVNNKAALVSWETIDTWAKSNYSGYNGCLKDDWNRSFVGFDLALKSLEDSYAKGTNGEPIYAMLNDFTNLNNVHYVWDGTSVKTIGPAPAAVEDQDITNTVFTGMSNVTYNETTKYWTWNSGNAEKSGLDIDLTSYTKMVIEYDGATQKDYTLQLGYEGTLTGWDQNRKSGETKVEVDITNATKLKSLQFMNGAPLTIKSIKLSVGSADEFYTSNYILGNGNQLRLMDSNMNMYAGESQTITDGDLQTTVNGKLCLNIAKINELVTEGFLPVAGSALKTWAKWADSDGYYSDWIVTLTEAKKIPTEVITSDGDLRVMAEDLNATGGDDTDFDFNDIVFDVYFGSTPKVVIRAAGGTLPLRIAKVQAPADDNDAHWSEVHDLFQSANPGKSCSGMMINTNGTNSNKPGVKAKSLDGLTCPEFTLPWAITTNTGVKEIKIQVKKNNIWCTIDATTGGPAAKFAVPTTYTWRNERVSIKDEVTTFTQWVAGNSSLVWPK